MKRNHIDAERINKKKEAILDFVNFLKFCNERFKQDGSYQPLSYFLNRNKKNNPLHKRKKGVSENLSLANYGMYLAQNMGLNLVDIRSPHFGHVFKDLDIDKILFRIQNIKIVYLDPSLHSLLLSIDKIDNILSEEILNNLFPKKNVIPLPANINIPSINNKDNAIDKTTTEINSSTNNKNTANNKMSILNICDNQRDDNFSFNTRDLFFSSQNTPPVNEIPFNLINQSPVVNDSHFNILLNSETIHKSKSIVHDELSGPVIKKEPIATVTIETEDTPVLILNRTELMEVIKILISNQENNCSSEADYDNCTSLAEGVINYLKTQIKPKQAADINFSLGHFEVDTTYKNLPLTKAIKQESPSCSNSTNSNSNRKSSLRNAQVLPTVFESIVYRNTHFGQQVPFSTHYLEKTNRGTVVVELDKPIIDLEYYKQPSCYYHEINDKLIMLAKNNAFGVSFGIISLMPCGEEVKEIGHMLVYYANQHLVTFIDPQEYNRNPIFTKLTDVFRFAKIGTTENCFGNIVFYTAMGPKSNNSLNDVQKNLLSKKK